MSDQQPSKTPTTDQAEALGPVTVLETCRVFEMGIKELRQQAVTSNAEVERLKAEAQQVELDKRALRDAVNTSDALAKVVKDLLANSKALASAITQAPHHRMCNFLSARHIDTCNCWKSTALAAHNKLMEQLSPTAAGSGMGG